MITEYKAELPTDLEFAEKPRVRSPETIKTPRPPPQPRPMRQTHAEAVLQQMADLVLQQFTAPEPPPLSSNSLFNSSTPKRSPDKSTTDDDRQKQRTDIKQAKKQERKRKEAEAAVQDAALFTAYASPSDAASVVARAAELVLKQVSSDPPVPSPLLLSNNSLISNNVSHSCGRTHADVELVGRVEKKEKNQIKRDFKAERKREGMEAVVQEAAMYAARPLPVSGPLIASASKRPSATVIIREDMTVPLPLVKLSVIFKVPSPRKANINRMPGRNEDQRVCKRQSTSVALYMRNRKVGAALPSLAPKQIDSPPKLYVAPTAPYLPKIPAPPSHKASSRALKEVVQWTIQEPSEKAEELRRLKRMQLQRERASNRSPGGEEPRDRV